MFVCIVVISSKILDVNGYTFIFIKKLTDNIFCYC